MKQVQFLALAALLLAGCAGGGDGDTGGDTGSASGRPQFLSVGTAPPGGAFFPVGGAIAETINDHKGDNTWETTAEATKGSQENIRRLDSGELDLALANSAISYFAVRGERGWDQAYPIRTVMTLAPNVALFITAESSGVKSVADLEGQRVVLGPAGAGFEFFLEPLLAAHGVTYADLTELHDTQTGAVALLGDGSAAAAFLGGAVPTASIVQAATSNDIHYIPFLPEKIDELTEAYLFFSRATIPAGTYRGLDEDYNGLDVGSMHLITTAGHDEELIYRLTRTLYENRAAVVEKHPAGRAINPKNVIRDTGTPFHPGAIRFYREIGIWPEERDAQ